MLPRFTTILTQLLGLTLLSRLLGMFRDLVLAWMIGGGLAADVLACALRIPHLLRRLCTEGILSLTLTHTFLSLKTQSPNYKLKSNQESTLEAYGFKKLELRVSLILGLILGVMALAAPYLSSLLAPNFPLPFRDKLTWLLYLTLPYLFFVGLSALSMAKLHSLGIYWISASLPIMLNIGLLLALGLAYGLDLPLESSVVLALSGCGFLQWWVQRFYYYRLQPKKFLASRLDLNLALSQTYIIKLSQALKDIPLGILAASGQHLALLVAMIFLSGWGEGQVAAQFYAERILEFPLGLIAVGLGTASLPLLSRLISQAKYTVFVRQLAEAFHWAILLMIPATLGLWAVGDDLITLLLGHGQFQKEALLRTSFMLKIYLPLIILISLQRVLISTNIALKGTLK
ncbi:MAG: murein biosynthesis protein MurJ, partial [Desulfovibrionaceae bacterium]|nr:murein biosynthesis protein MurJ [Desulfovibrionaceae bacterium]